MAMRFTMGRIRSAEYTYRMVNICATTRSDGSNFIWLKILIDDYCDIQIHGFCDASNNGYGACIYIRSRGKYHDTLVRLLCARSRVAPLKTITIPRLELCGALLLAHLYHEASSTLKIIPNKIILWCDSTIVLHWIKTSSHLLKTFVANRVIEIQRLTNAEVWRHVKSEDNPADALSRGRLLHAIRHGSRVLRGWARVKTNGLIELCQRLKYRN